MARTTSDLVKELLRLGTEGGDYDNRNNPSLSPYIDAANLIVTRVDACATTRGWTLSSAEKEMIERYLSAHNYAMSDQTYSSRKTGDASGVFHGMTGKRLDGTKYGQMALSLDPSGCLNSIVNSKRVDCLWLGRPPSEQTPIDQRE
jgi:hypothetical protein